MLSESHLRLFISYRFPSLGCLTSDGNVTIMLYIKSDYFFEGIALGLKACTQGYNVLFKNAATLSTELCEAKDNYRLGKLERTLAKADLLILDEVLGLIDNEIITVEDLKNLLEARDGETDIIMTGISLNDDLCLVADEVSRIETLKFKRW